MSHSPQRILFTNCTGMIGANLARRLLRDHHDIYAIIRPNGNRSRIRDIESQLHIIEADLMDTSSIRNAVAKAKPDVVYHLACPLWSQIPDEQSSIHIEANLLGTYHLLDALRGFPSARFIYSGSCAAYGSGLQLTETQMLNPGNVYGASKACVSVLVKTFANQYNLHTVELRLFTPYGPWDHPFRIIPYTILSALDGIDINITSGTQQRDFVFLDDVLKAFLTAKDHDIAAGSVINIGSGISTSILDAVNHILDIMNYPVAVHAGAVENRRDEIQVIAADISNAKQVLNWKPETSLHDGLRQTVDWFMQHREWVKLYGEFTN